MPLCRKAEVTQTQRRTSHDVSEFKGPKTARFSLFGGEKSKRLKGLKKIDAVIFKLVGHRTFREWNFETELAGRICTR